MTLTINSSYQTLDYIAGRNRNQQEAVARPARIRFHVDVTGFGSGEARLKGLNFGALVLEEPSFSWGIIALDALPVGSVPLATACILDWISTDTGIYTGADVGFRMQGDTQTRHYKFSLTFEGSTLRSTANTGMNMSPDVQSSTLFKR